MILYEAPSSAVRATPEEIEMFSDAWDVVGAARVIDIQFIVEVDCTYGARL